MTAPRALTETDMANGALGHIGEPAISSLDDAKRKAARECKRAFATVRECLLRATPWQFAKAAVRPASIGAAPNGRYFYRYAMPDDCVTVRSIEGAADDAWEVESSGDDADIRTFVDTSVASALIVYTRRVVNPAQWDELFVTVFQLRLAAKINPSVGRDKGKTNDLLAQAERELTKAMQRDAQERSAQFITRDTSWIDARYGAGVPGGSRLRF